MKKTRRTAAHSLDGRPLLRSAALGMTGFCLTAFLVLGDITGTVFRDNSTSTPDGIQNGGESGPGSAVTVTAIDSVGGTVTTTSDPTTGAYTLTTGAGDYRIEFSSLPAGFSPSPTTGGATTQYASNGEIANFAVLSLTDACDANPFTFTPCYVTGDPAISSVGEQDAIVGFRFNDSGDSTDNKVIMADIDEVGSTWGAAYDPLRQKAYFSAVVRRHVSLGPGGVGQIYSVDLSDFSVFSNPGVSAVSNLVNIPGANPVGAVLPGVTIDLSNSARDIAGDASADLSADLNGFQAVGRVGLGDIDISADFNTLYAINLGAKSLISVDLTNNTVGAGLDIYDNSPASVTGVCAKSEFRPWAIKIDGNDVYVGAVCSGEAAGTLRAFILQLNPAGTAFTETFAYNLPLTGRQTAWTRTDASFGLFDAADRAATLAATQWKSWIGTAASDWPVTTVVAPFPVPDPQDDYVIHAQPMLSDIEIDPSDGSFILGYNDRQAMIGGFQQDQPSAANNTSGIRSFVTIGAGDIIRVENTAGTLTVASGEYYTGELWNNGAFDEHQETALGSLAVKPDASEVMVTVFDPLDGPDNLFNSGGTRRLSNASGAFVESFRIYDRTSAGTTFAKAAGLGDLEIACNTPIVVGDFVFNDLDQDGQQDVDEPGILGVVIQIFDSSGTQVGGDITTGPNGEWVSPELQSGADYCAVFPASNFAVAGALNNFQATIPNASGVADNIDSELTVISGQTGGLDTFNGEIGICFNSGTVTSFDFDAGVVDVSNLPGVGNLVWVEDASSQNGVYNFGVDTPADGVLVQLYAAGATPGVDSPVGADTTDSSGCYEIRAAAGDYFIHIPASNFASGDLAGTVSVSGNGADDQSDDNISGLADNGIDSISPSTTGISSGVFNLTVGGEDATEGGKAGGADSPDLNVDYTIDFGFKNISVEPACTLDSTVGNVAVPPNTTVNTTFVVPSGAAAISASNPLTVKFRMQASGGGGRSITDISLIAPGGQGSVVLWDIANFGIAGDNFNLIWTDAATIALSADTADHILADPFTNRPRLPQNALSTLNGVNPVGTWTLSISFGNFGGYTTSFQEAELCLGTSSTSPQVGVGNLVFTENSGGNGIFDSGTDTPVSGVTVQLLDSGSQVVGSAVTDENGCYLIVTDPGTGFTVRIPSTEFASGRPLGSVTASLTDGVNVVDDDDDNGVGTADLTTLQANGVSSASFDLTVNGEPNGETGKGSEIDDASDDNVDLTQDFGFSEEAACTLEIATLTGSNYDASNGGTMDISITIDYTGAASEQSFTFTIDGVDYTGILDVADPDDGSKTFTFIGVGIDTSVVANFTGTTELIKTDSIALTTPIPAPVVCDPLTDIGGFVYLDYDLNGVQDTADPGFGSSGLTVTAYDSSNSAVAAAFVSIDGSYSLADLTPPVRLELSGNPDFLTSGGVGTNSGSNTMFIIEQTCDADFALLRSADYCDPNPLVVTPCYINGNQSGTQDVLVGWSHDGSGTEQFIASANEIGTTWGLAYQRATSKLYAGSLVKRHSGLGSQGLGGIYVITNPAAASPTKTVGNFVDLEASPFNINFGSLGDNTARGLPAAVTGANQDEFAFAAAGKEGMGDIDLSDDENTLWVVNLFNRSLIKLDVTNGAAPTSHEEFLIDNILNVPTATDGVLRPWALKIRDGVGYLGVVATAENATADGEGTAADAARDNLRAYVLSFDPTNPTAFTEVLDVDLGYVKGSANRFGTAGPNRRWNVWRDDLVITNWASSGFSNFGVNFSGSQHPSPILADIEFDEEGALILGFMDRGGLQIGSLNLHPFGDQPANAPGQDGVVRQTFLDYNSGGEILRAAPDGSGGYTLESNGVAGSRSAGTHNTFAANLSVQGPGGREFYDDGIDVSGNDTHEELAFGGLAQLKGSNLLVWTGYDPDALNSGGVFWNSNLDGSRTRDEQLYAGTNVFGAAGQPANGSSGKTVGLGDVELICDEPPLIVGNRVWQDTNQNGVQDPGEPGIAGVTVTLTCGANSITTMTAADNPATPWDETGTYSFSNATGGNAENTLVENSPCTLSISLSDPALGENNLITTGSSATNDEHDNDADSMGVITFTSSNPGNNDYSQDFGLMPSCSLDAVTVSASNYDAGSDTMDVSITVDYTGAASEQSFTFTIDGVDYTGVLDVADPTDGSKTFTFTGVGIDTAVIANFTGGTEPAKTDTDSTSLVTPEVGIGNYVWHDDNNNGIADSGESPIHLDMSATDDPIQVTLYLDRDGDGVQEPAGDDAPAIATNTITASANGGTDSNYGFTGLVPGTYYVQLTDLPDLIGLSSTTIDGSDDQINNDDNGVQPGVPGTAITSRMINLQVGAETNDAGTTGGNIDETIDFGLVDPSIGNLVWHDRNNNGMVDDGEPGLPNVTVNLYNNNDLATIIDTVTTDPSGFYLFSDLQLGQSYVVEIPASNFAANGALEIYRFSSDGSNGDTQVDEDDNGDQPAGPGTVIRSTAITLTANAEPVDGAGSGQESGRGADLDNLDDNNSDMTIDFGVYGCEIFVENTQVINLAIDGSGVITYDIIANGSYHGGPGTGEFELQAGGVSLNIPPFTPGETELPSTTVGLSGIVVDEDGPFTLTGVFTDDTSCSKLINYFPPEAPACTAGQVGGIVFRDGNSDGKKDSGEAGSPFVAVRAYDCDNNLIGYAVSDKDGDFTLVALDGTTVVNAADYPSGLRLEFDVDNDGALKGTVAGGTLTQFVSASGNCDVEVGLANPAENCEQTPFVILPCYVNGDPLLGGDAGTADWLVRVPYAPSGTSGENVYLADGQVIGAVWGTAYQASTDTVFSAALTKRHSGYGIGGPGAIYRTDDVSGTAPFTSSLLVDLQGVNGIDVGSITRDLPADKNDNSRDAEAFDGVGKIGLGDLDISEDGTTLYTINLNSKSLVIIPIDNPTAATEVPIDSSLLSVVNGEFRPWAVGVRDGEVFIGGVASGESEGALTENLIAFVLKYTPTATSEFIEVLEFPLDYQRDVLSSSGAITISSDWRPWINEWTDISNPTPDNGPFNQTGYPQPILTDVAFDSDGTFILGLMDRFGMQGGNQQWSTIDGDTETYEAVAGGDLLKLYPLSTGGYGLETNGGPPANALGANLGTSAGAGNNEGPDGGEFFFDDRFTVGAAQVHTETSLGGLAVLPGSNIVLVSVYDPVNGSFGDVRSGGVRWYSTVTGANSSAYEVYEMDAGGDDPGTSNQQETAATFGKAAGIGDPSLTCDEAGVEIGNYLFVDTDNDGVQDACDLPLAGVNVTLYDSTGVLVSTAVTNAGGHYIFSSQSGVDGTSEKFGLAALTPDVEGGVAKTFYVVVGDQGTAQFNGTTSVLTVDSISYDLAIADVSNTGVNSIADEADSDGINGSPAGTSLTNVLFTTVSIPAGSYGCHNHSFDFGFVPARDFGDAPNSYLTRFEDNGANHVIVPDLSIGGAPDGEDNVNPDGTATVDGADEDGVTFPDGLTLPTAAGDYCANVVVNLPTVLTNSVIATDDFSSAGSYAGGTGWNTDWLEIFGESDGAAAGSLQVVGGQLQVHSNDKEICRQVVIPANASNVVITFDYESVGAFSGDLTFDLFDNVAMEYVSLSTVSQGNGSFTLDVTDFITLGAANEFCFNTEFLSGAEASEGFNIDNFTVTADQPSTNDANANLVAWIDIDQNGVFDADEAEIISGVSINGDGATANKLTWSIDPADYGVGGPTYARFRLSTDPRLDATYSGGSVSDGEVEDYALTMPSYDYGDLPEGGAKDFPTAGTGAGDRPRHLLGSGLTLGSTVDADVNGQPNNTATGDGADEDGFPILPDLVPGQTYIIPFTATVPVTVTADVYLNAWIDFNCDGMLTIDEKISGAGSTLPGTPAANADISDGANSITFTVPADATPGSSFARFRLSTTETLLPTGDAGDGEVEDYLLTILAPLGAIGNYVWLDENSDGFQDAGEPGIPNVKVDLALPGGGTISTFTDANGGYLFDELPAGSYTVSVDNSTIPTGFTQTPPATNGDGDFGNKDAAGYVIALGSGDLNLTADFGYNANPAIDVNEGINTAALGDRVWIDADQDGRQDPEEIGVPGVILNLCTAGPDGLLGTADDIEQATQTTDSNGNYLFDGLTPGAYLVKVDSDSTGAGGPLDGYTQFGDPDHFATTGVNDNQTTAPVIIGPGDVFLNVDFGYDNDAVLGSIGDRVWLDENASGTNAGADKAASGNEPGIDGVTVSLINDANGDGIYTPLGDDNAVGGTGNNADEPIIGTTITDAAGCYLFDGLPAGDYIVVVNDTDGVLSGLNQTYDSSGSLDNTSAVTLTAGENNTTQDFSYTPLPSFGSIGDTVWLDLDNSGGNQSTQGLEPGINNVAVTLTDSAGNTVGTTTTDSNGNYLFSNLPFGDYTVTVTPPAGFTQTYDQDSPITDNVSTSTITISDPHDRDQDFSYTPSSVNFGSIGDKVWVDSTAPGVAGDLTQSATEFGLAGVTVTLMPPSGVNAGAGVDVALTTTTDENGCYLFTNLPLVFTFPYVVTITPPAGYTNDSDSDSPLGSGDGTSSIVIDGPTSNPRNQDFTLDTINNLVSVGSTIWFDANSNSDPTEDPGANGSAGTRESGIPGVTVKLLDSGVLIDTRVTDSNGEYLFTNVQGSQTYTVMVDTSTLPDGVSPVSTYEQDSITGGDSMVEIVDISTRLDVDFSYPPAGAIGDKVFFDGNGDGAPNVGEGLPMVTVELRDNTNTAIATTTTDANGCYLFPNLSAGDYRVAILTATLEFPIATTNTVDPDGGLVGISDVPLSVGQTRLDQDFGYQGSTAEAGSLGTLVWEDHNADGISTGPNGPDGAASTDDDEPSIPGVTVDLYIDRNGNGVRDADDPQIGTAVTTGTATDNYLFDDLPTSSTAPAIGDAPAGAAHYIVHVSDRDGVLAGYWHSRGSQDVATDNTSKEDDYPVFLTNATPDVLTVDFGYYKDLAKVGNLVWNDDVDGDGIGDGIQGSLATEPGIAGVELTLTITYPTAVVTVNTVTDTMGNYNFCNLLADEDYPTVGGGRPSFSIAVTPPSGFELTQTDQGTGGAQDLLDSDASGVAAIPVQGLEETAQLADASGELAIASYDFGLVVSIKSNSYTDFLVDNSTTLGLDDNLTNGVASPGVPVTDPLSGGINVDITSPGAPDLAGLSDNPDGDIYNNLLEFALCFDPGSGAKTYPDGTPNQGFHIEMDGSVLNAKWNGPTDAAGITYSIQSSTDGQAWGNDIVVTPTAALPTNVTSEDGIVTGTTEYCFADLATNVPSGTTGGLLRLVVNGGTGLAETNAVTPVVGYQKVDVLDFCQTYSDPLLQPCLVTGTIGAAGTINTTTRVIDLSGTSGTQDLTSVLSSGTAYYLEVTSGDNIGHVFDIASFDATSITLSDNVATDLCTIAAPYSTQVGVPSDLAADNFVIRAHRTLESAFPIDDVDTTPAVEGFADGANATDAGTLLRLNRITGMLETYIATSSADSTVGANDGEQIWMATTTTVTEPGDVVPDNILPPGEGIFVHNFLGSDSFQIMQFGEVRTNQLAVPLKEGYNFVSSAHPLVIQKIDSGDSQSRLLNADATDGKFTFTGDGARSLADQMQLWVDDTATDAADVHLCYDVTFYLRSPDGSTDQWAKGGLAAPPEQEAIDFFQPDRSAIYCIQDAAKPGYYIPSPIVNPVPAVN